MKKQIKVHTAEGRFSSIIIGILPLAYACVTWLVRPEYINIFFVHPLGKILLITAITLELAGFFIMRMLTKVDL